MRTVDDYLNSLGGGAQLLVKLSFRRWGICSSEVKVNSLDDPIGDTPDIPSPTMMFVFDTFVPSKKLSCELELEALIYYSF